MNTFLIMFARARRSKTLHFLLRTSALYCIICMSILTIANGQENPCEPDDCGNPKPQWENGPDYEILLTALSPPCTLTVQYQHRQCGLRRDIKINDVIIQGNCSSLDPNYILNLATNLLIQSNPSNWPIGTVEAPTRWRVIRYGCVRVQNYGGDLNAVSPCDETKCCVREVAVYNIDSQSAQPCAPFFDWENTNYTWWDNTCPTNLPTPCFDACKFDIYNSLDPTQYP